MLEQGAQVPHMLSDGAAPNGDVVQINKNKI
jgi:hypothetical protein